MRSESEMMSDIKTIISSEIDSFTSYIISRRISTVSSLDTTFAFVFQDKNITSTLLKKIIEYVAQNDRNGVTFETKKDMGNLDFEVILVNAEIFYV